MKKVLIIIVLCFTITAFKSFKPFQRTPISFNQPLNFPSPNYNFDNNQLTKEGFELGKKLFYDKNLSLDNSISCSSCHKQRYAFADSGKTISPGAGQRLGTRNAPPIMNLAWNTSFFWDGNISDLDLQPIVPITSHVEMDERMDVIIEKLQRDPSYKKQFLRAFGNENITTTKVMKAFSQFMVMCVSSNSKYDNVMRKEGDSFSPAEKRGYVLVKQRCGACHAEPLFTDFSFRNNGLVQGNHPDEGRFIVTKDSKDKMKFKVPSLRNLSYTAPYMHDGRFISLDDVINHYTTITPGYPADTAITKQSPTGIPLSPQEKKDVISFLKTLDDSAFLNNPFLGEDR